MGVYLLHRHAENLQQSLLEFKANYKLPKDQEKPNPVCMVAKQAYLRNYCQQNTKSRNEPYSDTPCAASWSSASNVFWKNRAHYRSLPCSPVSELCKILITPCTGERTLKCINLQSHVHTVTHCVIGFPLSTHWRKKISQESLECEMLKTSCIQIISRARQIPFAICPFCLLGSCMPADWALVVMTMHCQAHGCRQGEKDWLYWQSCHDSKTTLTVQLPN